MPHDFLWWRDGVIYQIYPRSFLDTTGSGMGDLNGITHKLDYLADLGVDALWLSPINPSPDVDFGYDVSDYCAIDPKFGSLADFERLIRAAGDRGMRIVVDLVLNHTSDQHAWFRQSRSSRQDPCRDWYLWQDAHPGGQPPNNWQSVFGGSAWEWDAATRQYYYHMFYKEQPDVNWRNPKTRRALLDVFRFWADKGVKGFRLDVFNVFFKDALLRDNPCKLFGRRPFERQRHLYDYDQPEMADLLAELRQLLDAYPEAYTVGETFESDARKAASYCGAQSLHAAFNFEFTQSAWCAAGFARRINEWENALGQEKWPTWVLNNHDTPRSASRYTRAENDERLKLAAAMLLTLRGTPFLYYGEELGMRDIRLKRSQILDPIGRQYWPFYKGRDGCRAPMQWSAAPQAGFSAVQPWLPLHPDFRQRNVEAQLAQADSLLNFYKRLLALRRQQPALVSGSQQLLAHLPPDVLGILRQYEGVCVLALLNFGRSARTISLPDVGNQWQYCLSSDNDRQGSASETTISVRAEETVILRAG